jgi:cytochrome c553
MSRRAAAPVVVGVICAVAAFAAVTALDGDEDVPRPPPASATSAESSPGLTVFARMGCGNCHRLSAANSSGQIGPDLDQRLASYTPATLRAKIVDPYPAGEAFDVMPEDFGERLSDGELDALVSFLLATRAR